MRATTAATLAILAAASPLLLHADDSGATCAADGDCDAADGWTPWDDGDEDVDLSIVLASDAADVDCAGSVTRGAQATITEGLRAVLGQKARPDEAEQQQVYVALNGKNDGVLLSVAARGQHCFGTLAQEATEALAPAGGSVFEPKRLLSNTGRPITTWADVERSDFVLHVLLDREAWVWPGVRVGFSFSLGRTKISTVSLEPKVLLVEDLLTEQEAEDIIEVGSKNLFRSPERHYSDDPKFQNYRTSETGNLNDSQPSARALRRRCRQILRFDDLEMVEPLQLLRYTPGKWYKEHYDVFHNVADMNVEEDEAFFAAVPPELSEWGTQQRHLLWRIYSGAAPESASPDLLRAFAALFTRPNSDWFPNVRDPAFRVRVGGNTDDVDLVAAHAAWLRGAVCADASDPQACVIEAAELLDAVHEAFPTAPPSARLQRNRHVTMLPYLRGVEKGGETVFPLAHGESLFGNGDKIVRDGMAECSRGIFVPPTARAAAMFYHTTPDSTAVDRLSMHGGCPPVEGVKYAINVFCWNVPWKEGLRHVQG